ncbi:MAG TPA: MBL fold metallo-hydrolase [Planctomycetota bacterium]|nr:MBL fold metallo-hydrolase [Planctomycetota bacterium]
MNVKTFVLGPIQTSCYVAYANDNSTAIIVDAGGDPAEIIKFIKQHNLTPLYLVNTHGHIDHILGNPQLKNAFPKMQICIHPADARMLAESKSNLATELGFEFSSPEPDKLLNENDTISLGDLPDLTVVRAGKKNGEFKVLHLSGHTKGGIGLLYNHKNDANLLFSGDALFAGSIGRTDFPGGSLSELVTNIRKKVLTLPDNTVVYPGHGPSTTVGDEKHSNPFL